MQCAVTYIGVETTHVGEIPFSRFDRQALANGAMAGSLSLFPATAFIGLPEVSQRWSVGTIFIAYLRNTLLSGWGYCSFWGAKLGVLYLRQQFDLTLAGPPPK